MATVQRQAEAAAVLHAALVCLNRGGTCREPLTPVMFARPNPKGLQAVLYLLHLRICGAAHTKKVRSPWSLPPSARTSNQPAQLSLPDSHRAPACRDCMVAGAAAHLPGAGAGAGAGVQGGHARVGLQAGRRGGSRHRHRQVLCQRLPGWQQPAHRAHAAGPVVRLRQGEEGAEHCFSSGRARQRSLGCRRRRISTCLRQPNQEKWA